MWYALRAQPGAEVMVGLRPGATKESFQRAIQEGTAEDWLEHVRLRAGDAVFVRPALHTQSAGPGALRDSGALDLTYRVYDYNRHDAHGKTRELHIEKALNVIRFGEQRGGKITQRGWTAAAGWKHTSRPVIISPREWEFSKPSALPLRASTSIC